MHVLHAAGLEAIADGKLPKMLAASVEPVVPVTSDEPIGIDDQNVIDQRTR
jgi:hypothetical protein